MRSCPSRGTWIEMPIAFTASYIGPGRAPRGARGLKLEFADGSVLNSLSCPSRGTWIEILVRHSADGRLASCPSRGTWIEIKSLLPARARHIGRAPRGARGLKFTDPAGLGVSYGSRAPRGARGLKYFSRPARGAVLPSCPSRGTWIEMPISEGARPSHHLSCPSRGTWIEMRRTRTAIK